ncbi:N,N'-diacetylchitobiase domain protein, partial [Vibrio parahaemolyticus V-223/04]
CTREHASERGNLS